VSGKPGIDPSGGIVKAFVNDHEAPHGGRRIPEIVPVLEFRASPAGRLPETMDQE